MQLFWHGYTSIRLEAKTGDAECTLITDPFPNEAAMRFPKTTEPDIVVLSHQDKSQFNLEAVEPAAGEKGPFLIADPGEYEVRGVFVNGMQEPGADAGTERPVIYRFTAEGLTVGFLGGLKRSLTDKEVEQLGNIDILILSVGGSEYMDPKTAASVVAMVEPRMVVPTGYDIPGIKASLGGVDAFCKALGSCVRQDANRLKIAKKDLPADQLVVAVLERS
ncbi:MAG: hypothetical protein RL141_403 [Candidatus Parcubacteria bacterium]|jgi:L-ascorbate metabolism protein UlaG (beta-lactamase superfamily)